MQHEEYAIAAEWIERQALKDFFDAAPDTTRAALGLERVELEGAQIFSARHEPNILLNRVIGLGIDLPAMKRDIHQIRDHYTGQGIDEFFLHVQPWVRPAKTWNWLFEAGMKRDRGWTQFIRGPQMIAPVTTELRVARIGQAYAEDFGRIAAQGFGLSEAAIPAVAAMVGMPGWHHFMTFSGDRPVGAAALRVHKELAWFDWAATDPQYRRLGSQTTLLVHRIQTAVELGCRMLVTETGEAVRGDPQHSFRNLMRAGFNPTHTRENFVPDLAASAAGPVHLNVVEA